MLSRVMTVGCRRCGGGMAGEPFVSNVADGVRAGEQPGAGSGGAGGERGGDAAGGHRRARCWWPGRISPWSTSPGIWARTGC